MAKTPTRLAGPALLDSTPETVYTVPGSTIAVIKNIVVSNPGSAGTFTVTIGADAAATRWLDDIPVAAGGAVNMHLYMPMAAAQVIQAYASSDDIMVIAIGGDQYPA